MWTLHGLSFWLWLIGSIAAAVAMLAALHFTPNSVKRYVVIALTFLGGLFYFVEFFIPPRPGGPEESVLFGWNLTTTAAVVGNATQVVGGLTFLLGVYNLVRIHGNNIRRLRAGWINSLAFFIAFLLMAGSSFARDWNIFFGGSSPMPRWILDKQPPGVQSHDLYTFLFEGLLRPLDSTMFSILAFYIVSAAYRAFRIRSGEAAVLMVAALVLMMGQVPLGMLVTSQIPHGPSFLGIDWSLLRLEVFSQYVLNAVNGPVQRAILFGLGLGSLAMGLRIWLSLERGSFFGSEV